MNLKLEKLVKYLLYLFVFIFPFQIKYILVPSEQIYNEIAIYFNYFVLFFLLLFFFLYFFKKKKEYEVPKYLYIIAGLDIFVFISVLLSPNISVSLFKYLLLILSLSLFFILLNFKYSLKRVLIIFACSIFIHSSLGVWQFLAQSDFSSKYIGKALHDPSVLGTSVVELGQGRFLRAYGALDHPNILGALALFSLLFLIYVFLKYDLNLRSRLALYFVYFVNLFGLFASVSRSSFLALLVSFLIVFFGVIAKNNKETLRRFLFISLSSLLFFITVLLVFKPIFLSRLDTNSRLESRSVNERVEQFDYSSKLIKKNIWFGLGLGAYHQTLLDHGLESYEAQPVHNVFLLALSEIGIWGFLCFVYFIIYLLRDSPLFDNYYITIALFLSLFIFLIFDHWLWSLPFGMLFFFFILGITISIPRP